MLCVPLSHTSPHIVVIYFLVLPITLGHFQRQESFVLECPSSISCSVASSHVRLCVLWTVAHQTSLYMAAWGFSGKKTAVFAIPISGDLPNPVNPHLLMSLYWLAGSSPLAHPGRLLGCIVSLLIILWLSQWIYSYILKSLDSAKSACSAINYPSFLPQKLKGCLL